MYCIIVMDYFRQFDYLILAIFAYDDNNALN